MFRKAGLLLAGYYNKDSELRNDLVQEAYIKIFRNISTLQDVRKFYGWINTILVNTIYAYTRAHWREEFDVVDENGKSAIEEAGQPSESPETYWLEAERLDYINRALQTLPPLQRYTVEYYYFSDMSVAEIARICDCSEGTVKSRLDYARRKLRGTIEEIERTKQIKLHSLFVLPFLLFLTKETAYAAEGTVDTATAALVRERVLEKCATASGGVKTDTTETGKTEKAKLEKIQGEKNMTDKDVNVTSAATSIWKTATGKVMIAVLVSIVAIGIIMGGIFIVGNKENQPEKEVTAGGESTVPAESTTPSGSSMPVEEEPSLEGNADTDTNTGKVVSEDGYIHIGADSPKGTPIVYGHKPHEDIEFYTDIRKTFFALGEEVTIDLSYYDGNHKIMKCDDSDIIGAYTVRTWPKGLVIEGISSEDFTNSGATGLYLESSNIQVFWDVPEQEEAQEAAFFYMVGENGGEITGARYAGTVEEQYQSGIVKLGDCMVPAFTFFLTGRNGKGETVAKIGEICEPNLDISIGISTTRTGKSEQSELSAGITHGTVGGKSINSEMRMSAYQGEHFSSFHHSYETFIKENLPEEKQKYLYSVSARDGKIDSVSDDNNVSGRMLSAMLQYEELLKDYYHELVEQYENATTMMDKYAAYKKITAPVSIVLYDEEYKFYAYFASVVRRSYEYETYDGLEVEGYAVPTGNKVELEPTDCAPLSEQKPKEVEIPDIVPEPVAYYSKDGNMGKLEAVDRQIKEIYSVLQTEENAYMTSPEQAEAVKTLLQMARELYFIVCADNACMKSYSDIEKNAWLANYGLADFSDIIARYEEKGAFSHYMNVYMYQHIGCMDGKLQVIKDTLPMIDYAELTGTQRTALNFAKELLNVFYENKDNYQTVVRYYYEYASKTQNEDNEYFRTLTGYDARLDDMIAYEELIKDFPNWVIIE